MINCLLRRGDDLLCIDLPKEFAVAGQLVWTDSAYPWTVAIIGKAQHERKDRGS